MSMSPPLPKNIMQREQRCRPRKPTNERFLSNYKYYETYNSY